MSSPQSYELFFLLHNNLEKKWQKLSIFVKMHLKRVTLIKYFIKNPAADKSRGCGASRCAPDSATTPWHRGADRQHP